MLWLVSHACSAKADFELLKLSFVDLIDVVNLDFLQDLRHVFGRFIDQDSEESKLR